MSLRPLVIIGAGGHGREILDVVEAINSVTPTYRLLGFLDDREPDPELLNREGGGYLGSVDMLASFEAEYIIGIGSGVSRRAVDDRIRGFGRRAATLVHPLASLGSSVRLQCGVMIAAGARVTTNVVIGEHTHLNCNSTVGHDCRLGDFVTLSPGSHLSGNVYLMDGVTMGVGSVVIEGKTVGYETLVGAGAVVIADIPARVTAVGVPARVLLS